MPTTNEFTAFLESLAPLRLAEEWDNVGLLVGDRQASVTRVMTCLTITTASAAEAIERQAELIVSHHPLPFRPLKKLTTDNTTGKILLDLIRHGVAVYSPHTAFDSAASGINQQLADAIGLEKAVPLLPAIDDPDQLGSGRYGVLASAATLATVAERLKSFLSIDRVRYVGDLQKKIRKIAVGCGSGSSFLAVANRHACDLLVTGEAPFHSCLEAEALGMGLVLVGHFGSERFACVRLAQSLQEAFPDTTVWASAQEYDPLHTL